MSQLIEMTTQYLENTCRIGAYMQAERERRQIQARQSSRPASVCAFPSQQQANDDKLAKKYSMRVSRT